MEKKPENKYTYKDGIELRNIDENTSWESLYRSLLLATPKPDVAYYFVRQINLKKEIKAYNLTECSLNENFVKAVTAYGEYVKRDFNHACDLLYNKFITFAKNRFQEVLEGILGEYGFSPTEFADVIGYDHSVVSKVLSSAIPVPKNMLYAMALFFEYNIDECEEFFLQSPHPLHGCFPDNYFRAYVKSDNRSLQPFLDIVSKDLRLDNYERYLSNKKQQQFTDFFDPEKVYSYLVISDFETEDGKYDFGLKKRKEMKKQMAGVRRTYDDRLDITGL